MSTATTNSNIINLDELTDKQLRKKCLCYGLQNIPITRESRPFVINKLHECIEKEKKLALKRIPKKSIPSNLTEKNVEKFNLKTKQLTSARIVAANVLQELCKKEKKVLKTRVSKESNVTKSSDSASSPCVSKLPLSIKSIKKRPSLSETFGPKSKDNLTLNKNTSSIIMEKKENVSEKTTDIENVNKNKNVYDSLKKLTRSSMSIESHGNCTKNLNFHKSYTLVESILVDNKENIEAIPVDKDENIEGTFLDDKENIKSLNKDFGIKVENSFDKKSLENDNNSLSNLDDGSQTLDTSLENYILQEKDNVIIENNNNITSGSDKKTKTKLLLSDGHNESEFSCKEDSDSSTGNDCLDFFSSDELSTTEKYYSIRCKSFNIEV